MIAFDDIIVDRSSNRKLKPIVTDLFTTGTKLTFLLLLLRKFMLLYEKTSD